MLFFTSPKGGGAGLELFAWTWTDYFVATNKQYSV